MQIDDRTPPPRTPGVGVDRKEILAILAASGLAPALGIEAEDDHLFAHEAGR